MNAWIRKRTRTETTNQPSPIELYSMSKDVVLKPESDDPSVGVLSTHGTGLDDISDVEERPYSNVLPTHSGEPQSEGGTTNESVRTHCR